MLQTHRRIVLLILIALLATFSFLPSFDNFALDSSRIVSEGAAREEKNFAFFGDTGMAVRPRVDVSERGRGGWTDREGPFDFALKAAHRNRCELLFATPPFDRFSMTRAYRGNYSKFERFLSEVTLNGIYEEGHSSLVIEKVKILHYMAGSSFVRTICETGFNYGHSSFNFLTANPRAIVHSFDLGSHRYAKVMAAKLAEMFPGRITVHFGNSTVTVPEFIRDNPGFKCDLIFVDGGHTYSVAKSDLDNFISIANKKNNIIIFDDYPTDWGTDFGKAWDELVLGGKISEKFRCTRILHFQRGIAGGSVL